MSKLNYALTCFGCGYSEEVFELADTNLQANNLLLSVCWTGFVTVEEK